MGTSFHEFYGNWKAVALVTVVFFAFLFGFVQPRRHYEWRNAGIYSGFLIALFTEMFGVPLTIYLLSSVIKVPVISFGAMESHLWAYLLYRTGLLSIGKGVSVVMGISITVIIIGLLLLGAGWYFIFRGKGELVTRGIYRYLRHPQYLGLVLIIIAFNVQWPTVPTLIMAPILIVMYHRLAKREEAALAEKYGDEYRRYSRQVPGFLPVLSSRSVSPS